jgi:hypothetical protein
VRVDVVAITIRQQRILIARVHNTHAARSFPGPRQSNLFGLGLCLADPDDPDLASVVDLEVRRDPRVPVFLDDNVGSVRSMPAFFPAGEVSFFDAKAERQEDTFRPTPGFGVVTGGSRLPQGIEGGSPMASNAVLAASRLANSSSPSCLMRLAIRSVSESLRGSPPDTVLSATKANATTTHKNQARTLASCRQQAEAAPVRCSGLFGKACLRCPLLLSFFAP